MSKNKINQITPAIPNQKSINLNHGYFVVGASVEQFANMIADELKNPLLKVKYIDYLKKVGFKQVK